MRYNAILEKKRAMRKSKLKWTYHDPEKVWDRNSAEARSDPRRPPDEPVEVECWHCSQRYTSDKMVWGTKEGMRTLGPLWWCPTDDCDGAGFEFDIHPASKK